MNLKEINEKIDLMKGWFADIDKFIFDFLLDLQSKEHYVGHLGEIGVYYGKCLCKLAQYINENECLFGIDKYFSQENQKTSILNGIKRVSNMSLKQLHCLEADSNNIIVGNKIDDIMLQNQFRFIHIDGSHAGYNVYHDLELADNWLNKNGILVMDDWNYMIYPDVQKAFFRYQLLHPKSFEMFVLTDKKAYICRPSMHAYYLYKAHELKEFLKEYNFTETICETNNQLDTKTLFIFDNSKNELNDLDDAFYCI